MYCTVPFHLQSSKIICVINHLKGFCQWRTLPVFATTIKCCLNAHFLPRSFGTFITMGVPLVSDIEGKCVCWFVFPYLSPSLLILSNKNVHLMKKSCHSMLHLFVLVKGTLQNPQNPVSFDGDSVHVYACQFVPLENIPM